MFPRYRILSCTACLYTHVPSTGRDLRLKGGGKRREGSCAEFQRGEENDHNFFGQDVAPPKRTMEEELLATRREREKRKVKEMVEKRGGGANSRPLKFPRTYPTSFRSRCTYAVHSLSFFPPFSMLYTRLFVRQIRLTTCPVYPIRRTTTRTRSHRSRSACRTTRAWNRGTRPRTAGGGGSSAR